MSTLYSYVLAFNPGKVLLAIDETQTKVGTSGAMQAASIA
jgi:hypothetical protein